MDPCPATLALAGHALHDLCQRGTLSLQWRLKLELCSQAQREELYRLIRPAGVNVHVFISRDRVLNELLSLLEPRYENVLVCLLCQLGMAEYVLPRTEIVQGNLSVLARTAAEGGHLELVKALLEKSHQQSRDCHYVLIGAATGGHLHIMLYLLQHHRSALLVCFEDGQMPLSVALEGAAIYGRLEMVELLLAEGASAVETAMWAAASRGQLETTRLLLSRMSNVTVKNDIAWITHPEAVRLILSRLRLRISKATDAPLMLKNAAAAGDYELFSQLATTLGVEPRRIGYMGQAVGQGGNLDILRATLPGTGRTYHTHVIEGACEMGHLPMLQYMLEQGSFNSLGKALQKAAARGRLPCLELLLRSRGWATKTLSAALQQAVAAGRLEAARLLLAAGATVTDAMRNSVGADYPEVRALLGYPGGSLHC